MPLGLETEKQENPGVVKCHQMANIGNIHLIDLMNLMLKVRFIGLQTETPEEKFFLIKIKEYLSKIYGRMCRILSIRI